jgi:UDP-sugar pyrophosphorylase
MVVVVDNYIESLCISKKYDDLIACLYELKQYKLISYLNKYRNNKEVINSFFTNLLKLNQSYPGGISSYLISAKKSMNKDNVIKIDKANFKLVAPITKEIKTFSKEYLSCEKIGMKELTNTCFVLVAGGVGERLGYNDIKLSLPMDSITGYSYLEYYCRAILSLQQSCSESLIPFVIMVSKQTKLRTKLYLERNDFYGLDSRQITILEQNNVPAFSDKQCQLNYNVNTHEFITKPCGHGEIHSLIYRSNLLKNWKRQNKKWLFFFQDTNNLVFQNILPFLGSSVLNACDLNFMVVPKFVKDVLGSFVCIESKKENKRRFLAVEYNQLNNFIEEFDSGSCEEDYITDKGFSKFPGNINQFVVCLDSYSNNLDKCLGLMPEFVNYKTSCKSTNEFSNPARIETMMQDYIQKCSIDDRISFTSFLSKTVFSPAKYNFSQGEKRNNENQNAYSLLSSEKDLFKARIEILKAIGVDIDDDLQQPYKEKLIEQAKIILPIGSFLSYSQINKIFPCPQKVKFHKKSVFVCSDCDVVIYSLQLDGALIVSGCSGSVLKIRDVRISNRGYSYNLYNNDNNRDLSTNISGYYILKEEQVNINLNKPGCWLLDSSGLSFVGEN